MSAVCSRFNGAGDITGGEAGKAHRLEGKGDKAVGCDGEMGEGVDDAGGVRLGGGERKSSSSPS